MFEFYGWARVESTSGRRVWRDNGLFSPDDDVLYAQLKIQLDNLVESTRECVDLRRTVNGLVSLNVSGLRNHRDPSIFELFKWLAENGKRSTGVLFSRNVEDDDRSYDCDTYFRVFRLSRGEFIELDTLFEMPPNPAPVPAEYDFKNLGTDIDHAT